MAPVGQASTPASQPAAPVAAPPPWHADLEPEQLEFIKGRSYANVNEVAKALRHANAVIGTPESRVVKLPTSPEDPSWGDVYGKLGRPETPEKYDLPAREVAEGELDIVPEYRQTAHQLGLSQQQAKGLMEWFDGRMEQAAEAQTAQQAEVAKARAQAEYAEIQREYGARYAEAALCVDAACARFGIEAGLLEAMVQGASRKDVFRVLADVGRAMGEHRTPASSTAPGPGGFEGTPAWALEEIGRLSGDAAFQKAKRGGEEWAVKKWTRLFDLAYPGGKS